MILLGKLVLPGRILDRGALVIQNGRIMDIGAS